MINKTRQNSIIRIATFLSLTIFLLAGCFPKATPAVELTPITVQLKWLHQAQFAGFYAADLNGYYADEGLAVTFIQGGSGVDNIDSVLNGTAQFGISDPSALMVKRSEGEPVQAIACIYRRSPLVFISNADLGIIKPKDMIGKTIRTTADISPTLHTMMAHVGINPDQYTELDIPSTMETFSAGDADVWGVYTNSFMLTVKQAGYDINAIYPDDYGVHFYADSLFTTDHMIANDPDLILRFLRASLKGWTYVVENPGQVGDMVVHYNTEANPTLEVAKMTASLALVNTGVDQIGWMRSEDWASMEKTLREQGVLTGDLDVTQVYTLQFLKEIFGRP